jgi:capsular polysaccharide export protein
MRRTFLFLQGPATPFSPIWRGACVPKGIGSCGCISALVMWPTGRSAGPRPIGRVENLRDWLDEVYRQHEITDQVLFGDRRPAHRPVVTHGEACGVRTWVFEEGYFRPHGGTLEREGVNGRSLLPRDPNWFRDVGSRLPERHRRFPLTLLAAGGARCALPPGRGGEPCAFPPLPDTCALPRAAGVTFPRNFVFQA